MIDLLVEIWESIRRNKLRTCLTGFAVSWGLFMLIVLLGAGNGLVNAFNSGRSGIESNTMEIYAGYTSKPYGGFQRGREIFLNDGDVSLTESDLFSDYIDDVQPILETSVDLSYGRRSLTAHISGVYPEIQEMQKVDMLAGRFIDQVDIEERRKCLVVMQNTAQTLLDGGNYENIIGRYVKLGGTSFMVVGVMESNMTSNWHSVYAPYTTIRTVFNTGINIDNIKFSFHGLESVEENEAFEQAYRTAVNRKHNAAPDDSGSLYIFNNFTQSLQMNTAGNMIKLALWVVGILILLGGIVGVSNIMLITVRERIHEFGIRKAIGASPWQISKLIISESVAITAFFGYIGMVLGLVACEVLDKTLGQSSTSVLGMNVSAFLNPTVGVDTAIAAMLVLVVAGTLAGFIPARKAAGVKPIEALRAE